jgi:hypothetical protein
MVEVELVVGTAVVQPELFVCASARSVTAIVLAR